MITQLYSFSPGSYVTAEEWNANFKVLDNTNKQHAEALDDAYENLAFPNGDLSQVYSRARVFANSFSIDGNTVVLSPQCEYYKVLSSGQGLTINIPEGFNSEARILIQTQENRSLLPFSVNLTF